jgi:hypothetical protein
MLETSFSFGLNVTPLEMSHDMKAHVSFDPYNVADFDIIVKTCIPLSFRLIVLTELWEF